MSENPYSAPQASLDAPVNATLPAAPIWNPNAAACWSLLFTPMFGALLHMKNWQAMGKPDEARNAKWWAIGFAVATVLFWLASAMLPDAVLVAGLGRIGGFVMLISWYLISGRGQVQYVANNYGKAYAKRGWGKPFLCLFLVFCGIVVVAMALGVIAGLMNGSDGD